MKFIIGCYSPILFALITKFVLCLSKVIFRFIRLGFVLRAYVLEPRNYVWLGMGSHGLFGWLYMDVLSNRFFLRSPMTTKNIATSYK